jgi:hypothetical protein
MPPKICPRFSADFKRFLHGVRKPDAILIVCFPVPFLDLGDYTIQHSQNVRDPPLKGWLLLYTVSDCILCKLYRI